MLRVNHCKRSRIKTEAEQPAVTKITAEWGIVMNRLQSPFILTMTDFKAVPQSKGKLASFFSFWNLSSRFWQRNIYQKKTAKVAKSLRYS